jgi:integrative and conjugative element protein (TIGR02256 family)
VRRGVVWLPDHVAADLHNEARRLHPLETGGVLLGYRAEEDLVVSSALGPGSDAKHERYNFEPDHRWHAEEIAQRFRASEGRETYLGDWHTHPDIQSGRLSGTDRIAIRRVINSDEAQTPRPISAICYGGPDRWSTSAWQCEIRYRLFLPLLHVRELQLKQFSASNSGLES